MRKVKNFLCMILIILCIISTNTICFAATDIFRTFHSVDFSSTTGQEMVAFATLIFQNLDYINEMGTNMSTITDSKEVVLGYIRGTGNNYGFYISCHGDSTAFSPKNGDFDEYIYPSDISGYWHLVFLNSCSSGASDNFATAFNIYSSSDNRAFLGWYTIVSVAGSREWIGHFYNYAGTTGLRNACLLAADQCDNSTPIRMYGDKEWYDNAW